VRGATPASQRKSQSPRERGKKGSAGLDALAPRSVRPLPTVARADQLNRKLERRRVPVEVGDDFIPSRVAVRIAGKGEPGKAVVASRREQDERVPVSPPRRAD
jgi:hypothetical protein